MEDLKQNAADGRLVLHLDDGAITKIINACEDYSRALAQLKQQARALSTYPSGLRKHISTLAQNSRKPSKRRQLAPLPALMPRFNPTSTKWRK